MTQEDLLQKLWRRIDAYQKPDALDGMITWANDPDQPFGDTGPAIVRILAAGASKSDLGIVLRYVAYGAVFDTLYCIEESDVDKNDLEGFHEYLLSADPSGREGRPGVSPFRKMLLESRLDVGPRTAVSFLPIDTIEKELGLSVHAYVSMLEGAGHHAIVLGMEDCGIAPGAVYAYSENDLAEILKNSEPLLREQGWPTSPADFIRKLAAERLDEKHALLPIIRRAFGKG
jgi:hypothetical protein